MFVVQFCLTQYQVTNQLISTKCKVILQDLEKTQAAMRNFRRVPRAVSARLPNIIFTTPSTSSTQPILTSLFNNHIATQRAFFSADSKPPGTGVGGAAGGASSGVGGGGVGDKSTASASTAATSKPEEKKEAKDAAKVAEEEAVEKNTEVGVDSETIVRELQNASEEKAKENIDVKEVEKGMAGLLWFSDVFPTQIANWDIRPSLTATNHQKVIPQLLPKEVKVDRMVPRPRDGGVYVFFYFYVFIFRYQTCFLKQFNVFIFRQQVCIFQNVTRFRKSNPPLPEARAEKSEDP